MRVEVLNREHNRMVNVELLLKRAYKGARATAAASFALLLASSFLVFMAPSSPAAGSGGAGTLVAGKGSKEVTIEMSLPQGFAPAEVHIKTGTTVVWHNAEQVDYPIVSGYHQVVANNGSFASPEVPPGQSWARDFKKPGRFRYHDAMHGNASGLIVVTGEPVKNEPKEIEIDIVEKDPNDQQSWGFDPKSINIETGTTVTWRNTGAMTHTATAKDGTFDSGDIGPGKTYSYTFKKAGTYEYNCSPHPWMTGTIKVHEPGKDAPPAHHSGGSSSGSGSSSGGGSSSTGSSSGSSTSASGDEDAGPSTFDVSIVEPDAADPDSWGFDPSDLQVQVGDTVVWTNQGSTDHTVTAEGGAFDSGMIGPGDTFEYTFDEVGTFSYHCDPHPWMKGTVKVSEAPPPPGQGPSGAGSSGGSGSHSMDDMAGGDAATTASGDDVTSAAAETTSTEAALAAEQASSSIRDIPKTVASIASVVFVMSVAGAFILGRWWAQYMQSKGGAASA